MKKGVTMNNPMQSVMETILKLTGLLAIFSMMLIPEVAAAAAGAATTPGGIMAKEAMLNFNAATFFLVILAVVCFVAAVVFLLNKDFALAAGAFIAGIFSLGITSCVGKIQGTGGMAPLTGAANEDVFLMFATMVA